MNFRPAISFLTVAICLISGVCAVEAQIAGIPEKQEKTKEQNMHKTLRIGVVGLVHTHVHWVLGRQQSNDIKIVGIVESNHELAERYSKQHGFSMDLVYDSLEAMVAAEKPDAVMAFNTIYDHLAVVEYCAPRGIHVMVEKPLAVNLDHARQMAGLAKKHDIHLLTNYETSWYPTTHEAHRLVQSEERLRSIRKLNFYTGHPGPVEIGCNPEFLEWLTDPRLNGGGALPDFGCYGANLATWMLNGKQPVSITCVTRQNKPAVYPRVEDDATIIVDYPEAQVVIQASWNWSHSRKEMEIFGDGAFIRCFNGSEMSVMLNEKKGPKPLTPDSVSEADDPLSLFQKVVQENLVLSKFDTRGIENNMFVMRILEAAKIAAREKRTVFWSEVDD